LSEGFPVPWGLAAGSLVAGYRVEEPLGAGGMAVVYRARDERLGRPVALKVLAPALAADEEFRQRFTAESRAAAAVDHPHIIPVHEAGQAGLALFIAMRLVTGGDLRQVIAREGPCRRRGRRSSCPRLRPRWTRCTGRGWCTGTSSRGTSW
jgi:serine/threonine protein kinase